MWKQSWDGKPERLCTGCQNVFNVSYTDVVGEARQINQFIAVVVCLFSLAVIVVGVMNFPGHADLSFQAGSIVGMIWACVIFVAGFRLFGADVRITTSFRTKSELKTWNSKVEGSRFLAVVVLIPASIVAIQSLCLSAIGFPHPASMIAGLIGLTAGCIAGVSYAYLRMP
jgi:hypothetical protein